MVKRTKGLGNDDNGNKISSIVTSVIRGLNWAIFGSDIENENWLLDRTLDPLEIKLEDAILK